MNSITRNPVNGLYYGIAKLSGAGGRRLVTVNIANGVCTDIGALVDNFSSLTFHTDGTLFAATGNGATISPETLYRINTSTAAATLVKVMGNGADGEVIAYNYDDGMLYHWSGNGTAMMEKMDTVSGPSNFIPISGSLGTGEIFGAVYIGGGNFLDSHDK